MIGLGWVDGVDGVEMGLSGAHLALALLLAPAPPLLVPRGAPAVVADLLLRPAGPNELRADAALN